MLVPSHSNFKHRSQAAPVRVGELREVVSAAVSLVEGRVDTKKNANHLWHIRSPQDCRILALNVPYFFTVNLFVKVLSVLVAPEEWGIIWT